ncbi:DTW domain-containing protein [Babesia caballi]|uniref:DTW domain-containing protein n=1 Tax=Babesia caballi TaxID=5871 RepID=A0AAV4LPL6_BABCB|nr:DTW domain-containing protein [Babesia caballi]
MHQTAVRHQRLDREELVVLGGAGGRDAQCVHPYEVQILLLLEPAEPKHVLATIDAAQPVGKRRVLEAIVPANLRLGLHVVHVDLILGNVGNPGIHEGADRHGLRLGHDLHDAHEVVVGEGEAGLSAAAVVVEAVVELSDVDHDVVVVEVVVGQVEALEGVVQQPLRAEVRRLAQEYLRRVLAFRVRLSGQAHLDGVAEVLLEVRSEPPARFHVVIHHLVVEHFEGLLPQTLVADARSCEVDVLQLRPFKTRVHQLQQQQVAVALFDDGGVLSDGRLVGVDELGPHKRHALSFGRFPGSDQRVANQLVDGLFRLQFRLPEGVEDVVEPPSLVAAEEGERLACHDERRLRADVDMDGPILVAALRRADDDLSALELADAHWHCRGGVGGGVPGSNGRGPIAMSATGSTSPFIARLGLVPVSERCVACFGQAYCSCEQQPMLRRNAVPYQCSQQEPSESGKIGARSPRGGRYHVIYATQAPQILIARSVIQ